jgi:ABC-type polysaccharide/polyol phosphate transport system ATPase subunit
MNIIQFNQVSLWRRTPEEYTYDLKKTILSILEGKYRKPKRKLILERIQLTVKSGEKLGIICANGSGKSTLLKLICGILRPTQGHVWVQGDVTPLIELGAGFDPELTVIKNIIFNGVLLGFSRSEMQASTDLILELAELENYAYYPVKALSSEMVARLGFAIATEFRPDILILDEALSVGDKSFKRKCKKRIDQFWATHLTVVIVSHDLEFIRQGCDRVIWLNQGRIKFVGNADETIACYLNVVH